jgi:hypothetical protein
MTAKANKTAVVQKSESGNGSPSTQCQAAACDGATGAATGRAPQQSSGCASKPAAR